jgi:hypothetical protein
MAQVKDLSGANTVEQNSRAWKGQFRTSVRLNLEIGYQEDMPFLLG